MRTLGFLLSHKPLYCRFLTQLHSNYTAGINVILIYEIAAYLSVASDTPSSVARSNDLHVIDNDKGIQQIVEVFNSPRSSGFVTSDMS